MSTALVVIVDVAFSKQIQPLMHWLELQGVTFIVTVDVAFSKQIQPLMHWLELQGVTFIVTVYSNPQQTQRLPVLYLSCSLTPVQATNLK